MPATSVNELLLIAAILIFGGLGSIFWIWMLVDCLQRRSLERAARVRWALLIAFTHWLGAGIYAGSLYRAAKLARAPARFFE